LIQLRFQNPTYVTEVHIAIIFSFFEFLFRWWIGILCFWVWCCTEICEWKKKLYSFTL